MRLLSLRIVAAPLLLLTFFSASAQLILPRMIDVAPQSPSSASLGKFGSYPVNLSSGLIDISIPIYVITTPKLSVPIKLSYHGSGIKVNDVSSWAGLGWSVITGGSITRNVIGKADEMTDGYLSSSSYQEIKNTGDISFDKSQQSIQDYMFSMEIMQHDPEPDIFAYNFMGSAGRFIYNRDKTSLIRIPFDKSKIVPDFPNHLITITETDGTVYRFGKAFDGTNYSESTDYDNMGNGQLISIPVNWLLTSIVSADKKDTIQFKYASNAGTYITDNVERFVVYSEHTGPPGLLPYAGSNSTTYQSLINNYVELQPSEILFRDGKVVFETVQDRTDIANARRLNAVKIYSVDPANWGSYILQKTVQLNQSYFSGGERMRLDSVSFTAPAAPQPQVYRFGYNATNLPSRLSKAQDYWGYFNGQASNTSLIPPISIAEGTGYLTYYTYINREADINFARAASLERITYPTGGYTEFEFESNKYEEGYNSKTGGGLRIRQTRSYDGTSPIPVKKTYTYTDGYINIAPIQCYSNIVTYYKLLNEFSVAFGPDQQACVNPTETIKVNCFTSLPSVSLTNYDGNIVFYSDIKEYEGDVANNQGYTTYTYDYFGDNITSYAFPGKTHREINTWKRGQLLKQTVYNKDGIPVSAVINTYSNVEENQYQTEGILIGRVYSLHGSSCLIGPNCSGCAPPSIQGRYSFTNYSINSGIKKLVQSVSYVYDQKDPSIASITTTTYTYDNSSYQPSVITASTSVSERLVTKYLYPGNYNINPSTTDDASKGIKLLQDNNILIKPVEIYQQRQAVNNSLRTIGAVYNTFRPDIPVPASAYSLALTQAVTDFTPSSVSGYVIQKDSRYRQVVTYDQYDAAANLTQQGKVNDIKQSYLWGYKNTYPVVQVTGASYSNILATPNLNTNVLQTPSSDQALRDELNKIRQYLSSALVTTYTYKPLIGVTSITDANNRTSFYEYDEMGRLKLIKDKDGNIIKTFEYHYKQ